MKPHRLTLTALFLAMALVLSYVENLLPALPFLPPGVKLGLSHVVIMYCLFFVGAPSAFWIALLKSLFVLLTRGMIAAFLSLSGGMLSLLCLFTLSRVGGKRISYLALSATGAIVHNLGQLFGVSLLISHSFLFYYIPVLLISGLLTGLVTGILLRIVMPALAHLENHL